MKRIRLDVGVDPAHRLSMTDSFVTNYESDGLGR